MAGVVRILLAQPGVDCNPLNKWQQSPLMLAVGEDRAECVTAMEAEPRVERLPEGREAVGAGSDCM